MQNDGIKILYSFIDTETNVKYCHENKLKNLLKHAQRHHYESLQKLFDKKWGLSLRNRHGYTVLHYACLYDIPEAVSHLLYAGSDLNVCDLEGNQPLHIAVINSSVDIIRMLMDWGADGFCKKSSNMTPLEIAIQQERVDVVLDMLPHMSFSLKHHPICLVLTHGSDKMVAEVIREMTCDNFHCKGHDKYLLMIALMNEHDVGANDFQSMLSSKHLKTIFNHMENIRDDKVQLWIESLDTYANVANKFGNTLLHYSCFYGSSLVTKKLLGLNALSLENHEGNTPLHLSSLNGNAEITKLLLDSGVDPYARNMKKLCPISCACYEGHLNVVEVQLLKGVDPNCKYDVYKQCHDQISIHQREILPINIAITHLQDAIPQLLLNGAFINFPTVTKNGVTYSALHIKIIEMKKLALSDEFTFLPRRKWSQAPLYHLISAGAKLPNIFGDMHMITWSRNETSDDNAAFVRYLVQSGYKFKTNLKISKCLEEVQSKPYRLQCLTAKIVRTCLIPNAWVGVKNLQLPSQLKKYIVMNTSYVNL